MRVGQWLLTITIFRYMCYMIQLCGYIYTYIYIYIYIKGSSSVGRSPVLVYAAPGQKDAMTRSSGGRKRGVVIIMCIVISSITISCVISIGSIMATIRDFKDTVFTFLRIVLRFFDQFVVLCFCFFGLGPLKTVSSESPTCCM